MKSASMPSTFGEMVERIQNESADIMFERREKYGEDNISIMGESGVVVRLTDKMERLNQYQRVTDLFSAAATMRNMGFIETGTFNILVEKIHAVSTAKDETVDDTLLDLMNYAMIMLAVRRGWWGLPTDATEVTE